MLKIIAVIIGLIWPNTVPSRTKVGKGSTFYPIEKLNNGVFACGGAEWTDPDAPVCATLPPTRRSWGIPCGAWVHIENVRTGDSAWCKVMDRGPYGKHDANGEWFNSAKDSREAKAEGREPRKGKQRAVIDMSRSVSKKLGSNGMLKVRIRWWRNNDKHDLLNLVHFGGEIYK
jgi:hypothetical protein